jgi:hypothetical protein
MIRNKSGVTMIVGPSHFLWDGILRELPGNIANAPPEIGEWFTKSLKLKEAAFYTWGVPKDQLETFSKNRISNLLKDCPPDPIITGIFIAAQAATTIFILVIGWNTFAKL